jgi:hypothetical protein
MENKSIRIRTTPGVDKNIKIKLEQDFDFLEILSLKIGQEELYQTFCSSYGVVVGRVVVNKGFGVSNAKVSIFIPISDEDKKNELIKDLYPFKTPFEKNPSTGVRYNLLLSKQTCFLNKAVGSFPTKDEVLDNDIVLEVFDKYYKYTTKTNNSGDFMIFGVPVGTQQIHFDVDISDIGTASVRPYDLIADGYPEKLFESKAEFKSSSNLDLLPQIKGGNKTIDVIPFWGDTEQCEIGITRVDFDTNINITPTSLFFGSIFTDSGKMSINKGCNPKNDMGEQDNLRTGSGNIKMIRVKEIDPNQWGTNGIIQPLSLEEFSINGGDLIDDDGVFTYTLPMNIGHAITDEFGMLVPSPDPSIGIPTKGMYRFAMKFNEPPSNRKRRTATMLFPSMGVDFGGSGGYVRGNNAAGTEDQRFSTDINAYNPNQFDKDFHTFEWKQLYTIAHFIKKFKKGGNRFSFVGIKNTDVSGETNLFPFNNAIWKFDILFYLISYALNGFAYFLFMLTILISFCFGFCMNLRAKWDGVKIGKLKIPGFDIKILSLCFSVCLFAWLARLIGKITLPADGCGPNGDGYEFDLVSCNSNNGYCGEYRTIDSSSDAGANCANKSFNAGTSPNPFPPATTNNECMQTVYQWLCCVKYNLAENRNVIRRNFNDAWVLGTAYLFQFRYKSRIQKKKTGLSKKEKYCGPGADHVRGDNYKANTCCLDTDSASNDCDKCLLRGPSETRNHPYLGIPDYHQNWHNSATNDKRTGAVDLDDIIYCNTLMSTKIVSLGRVEMCEETLEQIESSIKAGRSLGEYTQRSNYYTGTYNEHGWDAGYWVEQLGETSYEDPRDVFLFLLSKTGCQPAFMFDRTQGCHEYELKDSNYFYIKEVSKIYNDIVTVVDNIGDEVFRPTKIIANSPEVDNQSGNPNDPNYKTADGGFSVDREVANRFSPCGSRGCVPYTKTSGNWDGDNGILGTGNQLWNGPWVTDPYSELSTYLEGFDTTNKASQRNNQNTKSNIPYFYFGIHPGKTAINKLRKEYFLEK